MLSVLTESDPIFVRNHTQFLPESVKSEYVRQICLSTNKKVTEATEVEIDKKISLKEKLKGVKLQTGFMLFKDEDESNKEHNH